MPGLAIFGITGRMGQMLLRALPEAPNFKLSGAIASASSVRLGEDAAGEGAASGVLITADSQVGLEGAAVAVDFSVASGVAAHTEACAALGVPILIGATGFDAAGQRGLELAARHIPVLIAANTSVGVNVMAQLVSLAAAKLGTGFDVEIFEVHHRFKRDAPSGTALTLGKEVASARGQPFEAVAVYDRTGQNAARTPGSIGFAVLRAGDIVGEHTVSFASAGERIEITHRATDRMAFAVGALKAADWLVGRPAGLYSMKDVLGL